MMRLDTRKLSAKTAKWFSMRYSWGSFLTVIALFGAVLCSGQALHADDVWSRISGFDRAWHRDKWKLRQCRDAPLFKFAGPRAGDAAYICVASRTAGLFVYKGGGIDISESFVVDRRSIAGLAKLADSARTRLKESRYLLHIPRSGNHDLWRDPFSTPAFNRDVWNRILYILPESHWEFSIQANEHRISERLIARHGKGIGFFREGAAGTLGRRAGHRPSRADADLLLRNSLLTYMDHLLWTGQIDVLYGVESEALYVQNVRAMQSMTALEADRGAMLQKWADRVVSQLQDASIRRQVLARSHGVESADFQRVVDHDLARLLGPFDRSNVFFDPEIDLSVCCFTPDVKSLISLYGLNPEVWRAEADMLRARASKARTEFIAAARQRDVPLFDNAINLMSRHGFKAGVLNVGAAHVFMTDDAGRLDYDRILPGLLRLFERRRDIRFVIARPYELSQSADFDFHGLVWPNNLAPHLNSRPISLFEASDPIQLPGENAHMRARVDRELVQTILEMEQRSPGRDPLLEPRRIGDADRLGVLLPRDRFVTQFEGLLGLFRLSRANLAIYDKGTRSSVFSFGFPRVANNTEAVGSDTLSVEGVLAPALDPHDRARQAGRTLIRKLRSDNPNFAAADFVIHHGGENSMEISISPRGRVHIDIDAGVLSNDKMQRAVAEFARYWEEVRYETGVQAGRSFLMRLAPRSGVGDVEVIVDFTGTPDGYRARVRLTGPTKTIDDLNRELMDFNFTVDVPADDRSVAARCCSDTM